LHLLGGNLEAKARITGGRAGQEPLLDQRVQLLLDSVAAVERVRDQQQVGPVRKVFVLDPALTRVQGLFGAMNDPGPNARACFWVVPGYRATLFLG